MEKILESEKFEFLRRRMVMHEEIFKTQVQELHHLYKLQKKLMHEFENGITRRNEIIAETKPTNSKFAVIHSFCASDDPREQDGRCSGEISRIPIKFDIERPSETAKSSLDMVEEQINLKRIDEETIVEVELTLSIGHCTRKKDLKATWLGKYVKEKNMLR